MNVQLLLRHGNAVFDATPILTDGVGSPIFLPPQFNPEIPLFAALLRHSVILQQHLHIPAENLGAVRQSAENNQLHRLPRRLVGTL